MHRHQFIAKSADDGLEINSDSLKDVYPRFGLKVRVLIVAQGSVMYRLFCCDVFETLLQAVLQGKLLRAQQGKKTK